ncbi:hypothetical protein [Oceanicoccus sp. KOV_DT_Chl]|uniref:hypothetical protein n=1 Tax=Oceanicoccus sp. KOV_DT_Chl TaxID=1904639 RepID=UPI000C7B0F9E|nr:hypothetical protein [Oceanicoccus sp. KOV_DT_Chl]
MTFMNTKIDYDRSAEEEAWIKEETAEQEVRYQKIYDEMDALKTTREQWYAEFFHRIKTRGFSFDGDNRAPVAEKDIPIKPDDREDQVIWKYGEFSIEEIEGK